MHRLWIIPILALSSATVARSADAQDAPKPKAERARMAFSKPLPRLDGTKLKATVVEVTYGPGESSAAHRHPCPVIGYVIEGTYRTQSGDEPEAVYTAGQAFYEAPGAVHRVSANASQDQPVRFLAYFVCDTDAPLSAPVTK
ncbi:MAG: cupin domain-containing protein [Gemmatimonadales bacterium]